MLFPYLKSIKTICKFFSSNRVFPMFKVHLDYKQKHDLTENVVINQNLGTY